MTLAFASLALPAGGRPLPLSAVLALCGPQRGFIAFRPRMDAENDDFHDPQIEARRRRQVAISEEMCAITNTADTENRDLLDAERKRIKELKKEFENIDDEIDSRFSAHTARDRLSAAMPRRSAPDEMVSDPQNPTAQWSRNGGFKSFGAMLVRAAKEKRQNVISPDLARWTAAGQSEQVGALGGFLIPPTFLEPIVLSVGSNSGLLSRCFQIPVQSNHMMMPTYEEAPYGAGVNVQTKAEGQEVTGSTIKFKKNFTELDEIEVMVEIPDTLLEDSRAVEATVDKIVRRDMTFELSNRILWGQTGGFLGCGASDAAVTVAAESSGNSGNIIVENTAGMLAAVNETEMSDLAWVAHPSTRKHIMLLKIGDTPVFTGSNGGALDKPANMLHGYPIIWSQAAKPLGTLGDLMLVDFAEYAVAVRDDGIRMRVSFDVEFKKGLVVYRFTIRAAGNPLRSKPIASKYGNFDTSSIVMLAAR